MKYERPLLHLGQGVKISGGEKYFRKIIKKHKIPFFALTWNASDLIESDHPSYIGRPGAFAERGSNFIVQNCDYIYLWAQGYRLWLLDMVLRILQEKQKNND